ncbi:hypothetical protein RSOLAG1IB_11139 [Rhizoctonia solani AG-1 IB]|uniref:Uncharacterized protein n=1 Tax=Thanatephorus cucumeris (strain AG1-IB / isolate 7/3/14) TaxID=1108050 RepID=A0A0B7F7A0_THACB|nr:hypothetical protein RSOLAG1IB_11139 [Rhizoctonia solani AG-1 IB]
MCQNREYNLYTFGVLNKVLKSGNVTLSSFISPALSGNDNDRPVGLAVQIDSGVPQSIYYSPVANSRKDPRDGEGLIAVGSMGSPTLKRCMLCRLVRIH